MVLQAGAADQVLDSAPDRACEALRAIQDVGREALDQLGRLLGLLDSADGPPPLVPHPGPRRPRAAARRPCERAGLPVRLRTLGAPKPLPAAVDGAAYRVIQEALTNALKHSGAAPTEVTVRYAIDGVGLEIVDSGRRSRASRMPAGHGLAGMRERIERHGGQLHAGPAAGGSGFAVSAFIPRTPARARRRRADARVSEPVRILIADDQALVRGGLRMILDAQPDLEVVGEAADGREALQRARELTPDLVLMDIRMPELDGLETTRRLLGRDPSPKVLVLTTFDLDDYVYDAIRAGASGFLLKSAPPQQLVAGIRTVMAGDALLAPEITRRLLDRFVSRPPRSSWHAPGPRRALPARTRGAAPDRRRPIQRRDRRRPLPQRSDRQDPRHPHPHKAPPPRPRPGRRARLPDRIHGRLHINPPIRGDTCSRPDDATGPPLDKRASPPAPTRRPLRTMGRRRHSRRAHARSAGGRVRVAQHAPELQEGPL